MTTSLESREGLGILLACLFILPAPPAGAQTVEDELVPFEPGAETPLAASQESMTPAAAAVGAGALAPSRGPAAAPREAAAMAAALATGGVRAPRRSAPAALATGGFSAVTTNWIAKEEAKDLSQGCDGGGADPLVFDLSGKGVRTVDRTVAYDIDGDGRLDSIHDIGPGTGLLVFDADRDGASGSTGRELLGDSTDIDGAGGAAGFCNGFQALRALAVKGVRDGVIDESELHMGWLGSRALSRLEKGYGLRMKVGSVTAEPVPLARAGVRAISLRGGNLRSIDDFDGRGNISIKKAGASFVRTDGTSGSYEDITFSLDQPSVALAAETASIRVEPFAAPEGLVLPSDAVVVALR